MHTCSTCNARCGTLCGALDDVALARLRALASDATVAAGRWIVHPGDASDTVFMLRSGHAHVARTTRDGKRQILAFIFPGDFFGLTFEQQYVYGVWADQESTLCQLTRERFDAFVAATPGFERRLRLQLTRLLDSAQELIFTLGRKSARERVASFIWYLHYKQRKLGRDSRTVAIPMSRADIADFLGLTSESVSRALTQLKREQLIHLPRPGEAEVVDLARLREAGVVIAEPAAEPPDALRRLPAATPG